MPPKAIISNRRKSATLFCHWVELKKKKTILRPVRKICQVIAGLKKKKYFQKSKNYSVSTEKEILIAEKHTS